MRMTTRLPFAAWLFVGGLMGVVAFSMFSATPAPRDDHFYYQEFVESLARGDLDLSIPGFHGSDVFAVPWYLLSRSPLAQIDVLRAWAILLPLLAFLAGRAVFRDAGSGVLLAAIVTLMPFTSFVALRGWTGPAYWGLMLLSIAAAAGGSLWVIVPFSLVVLTKPFAIALAPLLWVLMRRRRRPVACAAALCAAALLCAAYVVTQYVQAGRVFVGAHADIGVRTAFHFGKRFFLNGAHALQMLFSVHNYYFPDPAKTGPGNLLHTSPVLVFLGLYALGRTREFFRCRHLPIALGVGAAAGLGLNMLLDHMDHFYMEAGLFLLLLAALPILRAQWFWACLALATLHFQWLYFFLQYGSGFHLSWRFFAVPLYIDAAFFLFCCSQWRQILASVRAITLLPWGGRA